MKITNQTQRLIKVGPYVVLPNDTVEVDAITAQYPVLADLAECGAILIVDEKATKKDTEKATKKDTKKANAKADEKDTEEGK